MMKITHIIVAFPPDGPIIYRSAPQQPKQGLVPDHLTVHVARIEEVMLPGPGGMIPYERVHFHEGGMWGVTHAEFPKHTLLSIGYGE